MKIEARMMGEIGENGGGVIGSGQMGSIRENIIHDNSVQVMRIEVLCAVENSDCGAW